MITIIVTLETDLLVGVGVGTLTKFLLHLLWVVPVKDLFRITVKRVDFPDGNVNLNGYNSAISFNYPGFKEHLAKLPAGKTITIDFSGTTMVDHTFIEHVHHFESDYALTGGRINVVGLEHMQPLS